jgi:fibronectin type 3 domain-containing protein
MATRLLRHVLFLATTAMLAACGSGGGDGSGNAGTSPSANQLAVQPTASPSNQLAVQPTASPSTASVTLEWNANTEPDLAGYKVYRATSPGGYGAAIATVPAGTTSYVASGLQTGVTYFFVISAYDAAGNESIRSAEVSASL